jgi:FtsH-binding integral membrane protein
MDDNKLKKMGVWVIVMLFAVYFVSLIAICIFLELPMLAVVVYAVMMFLFLVVLAYEGWQRIKEIDGGLEDAVDNY